MTDTDKILFLFDLINQRLNNNGFPEIESMVLKDGTVLAINKLLRSNNNLDIGLLNELQKDSSNSLSSPDGHVQSDEKKSFDRSTFKNKFHVPKTIQRLLDIWKEHGLHLAKKGSKTFEQDVVSLKRMRRGTFFKDTPEYKLITTYKLSEEDWRKAVVNWSKKAIDPNYYPRNKGKLAKRPITWFLYNEYSKNGNKSNFLDCLENDPKPLVKPIESKNPNITSYLINEYQKLNEFNGTLTFKEEQKFVEATNKLVDWFHVNKKNIKPHAGYVLEMRKHLMNALVTEYSTEYIKPGTFCSEQTFAKVLPKYLHDMGFVRSSWQVQ